MFSSLDDFLVARSPPRLLTPTAQTAALGLVFFWIYSAYASIQFYSASVYGPSLAADCVSAVYAAIAAGSLVSPGVVNKFGCRRSMLCGAACFAPLVLASLVYFTRGGEGGVAWARWSVVAGGAIAGCGAAVLWTAQGRLILQYASRAEQLQAMRSDGNGVRGETVSSEKHTGRLLGLFWAIFRSSSLVGGLISFLYYNEKPEGSAALYVIFLLFIMVGSLFTQLLLPPSMLKIQNTP